MSVLRIIESKIAGLVEGTFSRAFRSEVRPVEIARKLAREMEEHKAQSLARSFAPNRYRVFLSPKDRERFAEVEDNLKEELAGYLLEHARAEGLSLPSPPTVDFETDARLGLGEFGIQATLVREHPPEQADEPARGAGGRSGAGRGAGGRGAAAGGAAAGGAAAGGAAAGGAAAGGAAARRAGPGVPPPHPAEVPAGQTMIYSTAGRLAEPLEERSGPPRARALLIHDQRRLVVAPSGATIGRSRKCEIVLSDANVSREHAELRPRGDSWVLRDLGSTNGTMLNGRRVDAPEVLKPGDQIELGSSSMIFELE